MSSKRSTAQDRGGVQVVRRVARILSSLKDEPDGLSLSQIAERVGLARSTVHRLVAALEEERFVVSASPNGRFRLGPAFTSLAARSTRDLAIELHPFLVELSREIEETVDLAILEHDHVVFIDQVAAPRRLRAVSSVGAHFPAHATANGKALLASLDDQEVRRILPETLDALTPATITSRAALLEELATVRETGIAYDREEHTAGICAVGTVAHASTGQPVALTVPLPATRFYGNEAALAEAVLRIRERIAAAVGPAGVGAV